MEAKLKYDEAYNRLEELVEQLEAGNIPLDKLTEKVRAANELIAICEDKLRHIEGDVATELNSKG